MNLSKKNWVLVEVSFNASAPVKGPRETRSELPVVAERRRDLFHACIFLFQHIDHRLIGVRHNYALCPIHVVIRDPAGAGSRLKDAFSVKGKVFQKKPTQFPRRVLVQRDIVKQRCFAVIQLGMSRLYLLKILFFPRHINFPFPLYCFGCSSQKSA